MLGYDPLFLACEGRVVAVASTDAADKLLMAWRRLSQGAEAEIVGSIETGKPRVLLTTGLGGQRLLPELEDDPLPRIC